MIRLKAKTFHVLMNLVHNDTEHCCTLWWNALTIEKPMTDTIWRLSIGNFFQRAGNLT